MAQKIIKRKTDRKAQYDNSKGIGDAVFAIDAAQMRKDLPDFSSGDTVKVHVKIKEGEKERIQLFEGLVIARRNREGGKSFIVRKISHGVGVERIFMETSPVVSKVEIVQKGKVRRSKLYYIRELEGRAARIERDVQTNQSAKQATAAASKVKA